MSKSEERKAQQERQKKKKKRDKKRKKKGKREDTSENEKDEQEVAVEHANEPTSEKVASSSLVEPRSHRTQKKKKKDDDDEDDRGNTRDDMRKDPNLEKTCPTSGAGHNTTELNRSTTTITTHNTNTDTNQNPTTTTSTPTRKNRKRQQRRQLQIHQRPRNGRGNDDDDDEGDNDDRNNRLGSGAKKRKVLPFVGRVVAISTSLGNGGGGDDDSNNDEDGIDGGEGAMNYKELRDYCSHVGGATVTNQIHKRLYCVVASAKAVQQQTQRVRKAWKKSIPVVTSEYVRECIRTRSLIPIPSSQYFVPPQPLLRKTTAAPSSSTQPSGNTKDEGDEGDGEGDPNSATNHAGWSEEMDLGCCCACHDKDDDPNDQGGEDSATATITLSSSSCPWCTGPERPCVVYRARLNNKK